MNPPGSDQPAPRVVGVIPMAGQASRLSGLPCSKEIFPVGVSDDAGRRPVAVCEHLLGAMRASGIGDAYVVLRDGKWDIPAYLGDGSRFGLNLAYLMMGRPWGTPYSIDQAFPFVRDCRVALGFPDMCFDPGQGPVFEPLLAHQATSGADVVLGIFPADRPQKCDMVDLGSDSQVRQLVIKPAVTKLQFTWGVAVWTPAFSTFMHDYLADHQHTAAGSPELFVGDVVQAALTAGLDVQGVQVSDRPYVDIGTHDDLARALTGNGPEGSTD